MDFEFLVAFQLSLYRRFSSHDGLSGLTTLASSALMQYVGLNCRHTIYGINLYSIVVGMNPYSNNSWELPFLLKFGPVLIIVV